LTLAKLRFWWNIIYFSFYRWWLRWCNTMCRRSYLLCTHQMVCTLCSFMSRWRMGLRKIIIKIENGFFFGLIIYQGKK
jgi:hypothetical protein